MPVEVTVPADLKARLGYKNLNRTWAKLEILLGLTAAGIGLFVGYWSLSIQGPGLDAGIMLAGLALFVFGFYLALAGHRSHLYQSTNEQTALLIAEIRALRSEEH